VASLLAALVLVLAPGAPRAGTPRDRARVLFKKGNALYLKGDYEGALRKYRAARDIFPNYKIDLNIANTLDDLRRPAAAIKEFQRFLRNAGSTVPAELVTKARSRMEELKERLRRKKQKSAGTTRSRPSRKPRKQPAGSKAATARKGSPRQDPDDMPAAAIRKRKLHTVVAWSSLGLGVACAATAGVLYVVGVNRRGTAYDNYSAARDQAVIDGHWEDVEQEEKKLIAGHVLAGVAAAAVGVSAYFFITRPSATEAPPTTRQSLRLVLGGSGQGAGLLLSGKF